MRLKYLRRCKTSEHVSVTDFFLEGQERVWKIHFSSLF